MTSPSSLVQIHNTIVPHNSLLIKLAARTKNNLFLNIIFPHEPGLRWAIQGPLFLTTLFNGDQIQNNSLHAG